MLQNHQSITTNENRPQQNFLKNLPLALHPCFHFYSLFSWTVELVLLSLCSEVTPAGPLMTFTLPNSAIVFIVLFWHFSSIHLLTHCIFSVTFFGAQLRPTGSKILVVGLAGLCFNKPFDAWWNLFKNCWSWVMPLFRRAGGWNPERLGSTP